MLFARLTLDDLSPMTPPSNDGFYLPFPVAQKKTKLVDETRLTSSQSQHISQMESNFENKIQSVGFSQECKKYISAVDDGELVVIQKKLSSSAFVCHPRVQKKNTFNA